MFNEEDYIRSKMGNRNPFTVPEGYFEQLTAQVMQKLPAQEMQAQQRLSAQEPKKSAVIRYLRPLLYAAACICLAMFGVTVYQNLDKQTADTLQSNIPQISMEYNDDFIDEAADYAMLDNEDIYASLLADI